MTVTATLTAAPNGEILRALNSSKAYLFFDISVFNAGAAITIKCTDNYKEINRNTWNGYDFILENDSTTKFYLVQELKERIKTRLDTFKTAAQLKRAKKLIKENS